MWEACIFLVTFNCINMEFILAFAAIANKPHVEESRCLEYVLLQSIIQMSIFDDVYRVERRTASPIRKYNWRLIALLLSENVGVIFLLKVLLSIWSGRVGGKDSWLVFSWKPSNCYLHDHMSISLTQITVTHTYTHTPLKYGRTQWIFFLFYSCSSTIVSIFLPLLSPAPLTPTSHLNPCVLTEM